MDQLPFNKIIVDSRHVSVGTSTNFEMTLLGRGWRQQGQAEGKPDRQVLNRGAPKSQKRGWLIRDFVYVSLRVKYVNNLKEDKTVDMIECHKQSSSVWFVVT